MEKNVVSDLMFPTLLGLAVNLNCLAGSTKPPAPAEPFTRC